MRDNFSAGGKFEYPGFGRISRIYATLGLCKVYVKEALEEATVEELYEDWNEPYSHAYADLDKFKEWLRIASNHCPPQSETGYNSLNLLCDIMK